MDAYKVAVKLLALPVTEGLPDELGVRQVLLGVYRLLKALCQGFKVRL